MNKIIALLAVGLILTLGGIAESSAQTTNDSNCWRKYDKCITPLNGALEAEEKKPLKDRDHEKIADLYRASALCHLQLVECRAATANVPPILKLPELVIIEELCEPCEGNTLPGCRRHCKPKQP